MSEFRKLVRLLEKEVGFQEKLLKLLTTERAAIVKLNQDEIASLTEKKEAILVEAQKLEVKRAELVESLQGDDVTKDVKLSDLVAICPEKEVKGELTRVGEELRRTAESVNDLNKENGVLIQQSLGLIASTISIIRSAPGSDLPTYGRGGKLSSDEQDPAFSRRGRGYSREV